MYGSIAVLVKSYFTKNQAHYVEQTRTIHFTINFFFLQRKCVQPRTRNIMKLYENAHTDCVALHEQHFHLLDTLRRALETGYI